MIPNLNSNMDDDDDTWMVVSDESYDSDQVDSDIEAELYSTIHHEAVSTESPDHNPELNGSINFIAVEESRVIEKDLDYNSNLNINSVNGSNSTQTVENKRSNKRKSNLIANILGNIQVQNESSRKKQKTIDHRNKTRDCNSSSGNTTIELSDSDSSVILSEPDESSVLKLQTNVETLYVSSDSESSVTCLDERRFSFCFNPSEDNNSTGNYKDLWKINDSDLYRTKRNSTGRYHENAVSQCSNCKEKGHVAKYCTEARVTKCFICGGAHVAFRCKKRICVKCLRYGHDSRRCFFPFDKLLCSICNMRGHAQKCCPDLWRRYHLTTSKGHIVRGPTSNQSNAIYCFNCGLQGHFGFECNKSRMGHSYPTWPSVVSYERPGGSFGEFQMERDFGPNIPQFKVPRIVSQRKGQKNLLSKKQMRANRKLKKQKGAIKAELKKAARAKQEAAVNSSILSNSNSESGNVRIKQEINFPRTPKANAGPSQCEDEMPLIKKTRRGPRLNRRKRMRKQEKRAAMSALKNCS